MPIISKSAKLFQERRIPSDQLTRRLPSPRSNMGRNLVHTLPLSPPFPIPEVLLKEDHNTPDQHLTKPWPHGYEEVAAS